MPNSNQNHKIFSHLSVLIVEDNLVAACSLKRTLTDLGAIVTHAETGKAAIELAKLKDFDFMILDHDLPDTTGPEIAKKVRQLDREREKRTPLILLTADLNEKRKKSSLEAGINVILNKPLTSEGIHQIVGGCLDFVIQL